MCATRPLERWRSPGVALVGTVVSVVLAACGDDGGDVRSSSSSAGRDDGPIASVEGARQIPVRGRSFSFGPDEVTARVGEDVTIVFTSVDGLHDFTIDELGAQVAAEAGETAIGGFKADEPGEYRFYCSVPGHREAGMEGLVVVAA